MTGKTPGQLGIYGFRNRKDTSYEGLSIATSDGRSRSPRSGTRSGRRAFVAADRRPAGVPAAEGVPGWRVGCFLTPPSAKSWAYPAELETEIVDELGGRERVHLRHPELPASRGTTSSLDQVFKMTERRFQVGRRLVKNKPWDFFMMCEIAPDRLHHVFWQHWDPSHPLYEPGNQYETRSRTTTGSSTTRSGRCSSVLPDDAITIVMSDHGARPMMGGLCFNDWLIQEGYLALDGEPLACRRRSRRRRSTGAGPLAWGDGGYYGRLFLNVKGREPQGIVEPARYEEVRDELIAKLEAMPGPDGSRSARRCSSRRTCTRRSGASRPT